jgi:hypothetical protein
MWEGPDKLSYCITYTHDWQHVKVAGQQMVAN